MLAFLVCHMQKLGSGALGGIQSHNNRERESKSNPDIDYSKSNQNYSLVDCENYRQAVKTNIDELNLKKAVRKDAVLACSFVITSSHDFFKNKPPDEQKAFFQDTIKFFQDRYGEKNIFSATVHMDEATPHMHLLLTPIRDNKLSAKAIFDRKELRSLQTDLHASIGLKNGLERGKEGSKAEHITNARYKALVAEKQAEKALEAQQAAEKKLAELTPRILTAAEAAKIAEKGKRTLFGNLKGVSITEFESLTKTAGLVEQTQARAGAIEAAAKAAGKQAAEAMEIIKQREQLLDGRERQLKVNQEKTPDKMIMKYAQDKKAEAEKWQSAFYNLTKRLRPFVAMLDKIMTREQAKEVTEAMRTPEKSHERGQGR